MGSLLPDVLAALKEDGQPSEAEWPYQPSKGVVLSWSPPAKITTVFRRDSEALTITIESLIALLEKEIPVVLMLKLSMGFYTPMVGQALAFDPASPPDPALRHAVVAVAHGSQGGDRCILVRNSWGDHWGEGGHAWLDESYLQEATIGHAILKDDPDGASSSFAA